MMTSSESTYLLAFDSTHAAMAAQKALAHTNPRIIPTPRDITAACGMSLRFAAAGDDGAIALVSDVADLSGLCTLYCIEEGLPSHYRLVKRM